MTRLENLSAKNRPAQWNEGETCHRAARPLDAEAATAAQACDAPTVGEAAHWAALNAEAAEEETTGLGGVECS